MYTIPIYVGRGSWDTNQLTAYFAKTQNMKSIFSSHLVTHHVYLGDRQLLVCGVGTEGSTGGYK